MESTIITIITLEEAIKIYESILAERLHGIKGLVLICRTGMRIIPGIRTHGGDRIDRDLIDMIPHIIRRSHWYKQSMTWKSI